MSRNLRIKIPTKGIERSVIVNSPIELSICGEGKLAYLWVGVNGNFLTYKDNTAELRHWLRRALQRMESQ